MTLVWHGLERDGVAPGTWQPPFQAVGKCELALPYVAGTARLTRFAAVVAGSESDGHFGGKPSHTYNFVRHVLITLRVIVHGRNSSLVAWPHAEREEYVLASDQDRPLTSSSSDWYFAAPMSAE